MAAKYPELIGKVACITGAGRSKGIGAEIGRRLATEGVHVVLSDIGAASGDAMPGDKIGTSAELERIVGEIKAAGGSAEAVVCDVLDEDQVKAMVQHCMEGPGRLDIMVNNAGIGYLMEPITEMSAETWDTVMNVNLRGAFFATKHAARAMIAAGNGGRIINVASQAAKSGFPYAVAYTSSKHGMVGLTRVSAIEFGKHRITVNAVCPNHITTGLGQWQNEYFSAALGMSEAEYLAAMKSRIPLGRPGLTLDIAKACAFLCSDEAEYVTGEAMNVSGGEEVH
jgi:meso-butanediol dehydrogenase/(S,S)-butanediol dehydrogenase/diacetyl reductase